MDLPSALRREALRKLPGATLFRIALALQRETRRDAAKRLGVTSSSVAMSLDPGGTRPVSHELAEKVEKLYGIPASSWDR